MWARGDFCSDADQAHTVHAVDEALAVWGLVAETPTVSAVDLFYLWPENVPAWQLFQRCATQWRSGMAGREGLDYLAVQLVMDMGPIRPRQRRQRFAEVQVMESAALEAWSEMQDKKN